RRLRARRRPGPLRNLNVLLLSHDHHDDNLDPAGRALLPSAGTVITTRSGARRLGGSVRGLQPWETTRLEDSDRLDVAITATPCRHGPPFSRPIVGDVVGFSVKVADRALWISGDTVRYDGVREV